MNVFTMLFDKIKKSIHNKYFREVHCSCCGTTGKILGYRRLRDGSLLCKTCANQLPSEWSDVLENGTLDDYKRSMAYARTSQEVYEPIFRNDAGYGSFEVDSRNLLFRNSGEGELIFPLSCLDYYDFSFTGVTPHEGIFRNTVSGNVHAVLLAADPDYHAQSMIAFDVTARAEKKLFSNTFVHGNPDGLDDFILRFDRLVHLAKQRNVPMRAAG